MANIMIIGFNEKEAIKIRKKVETALRKVSIVHDGITTIIPATTKACHMNKPTPYLLVRHTKIETAYKVALSIHKIIKTVDIEFEQIGGFIPGISGLEAIT